MMGRRLSLEIVLAAAVAGFGPVAGTAWAWQERPGSTPPPSPAAAGPDKTPTGVPSGPPSAAGLPADFSEPAAKSGPSNLGPRPPAYVADDTAGRPPADLPPAAELPAPGKVSAGTSDEPAALPDLSPAPDSAAMPSTLDEAVEPAQNRPKPAAAPAGKPAAGPARTLPAQVAARPPAPTPLAGPGDAAGPAPAHDERPSFVIPADQLPLGKQTLGLTVDVVAPQVLNIGQTATLKVVVKNNGATDAKGVVVRDELPEGLALVSSQPEATRIDALLSWHLGTVPAGSERVISLGVKPTKVGQFDHAATVTMMAGGKSRTTVREPKLKVEQSVSSAKILKGQQAQFKITVSNPGDGPARGVIVQAKLSPGLRHESGEPNDQNLFEQTIDSIGPGERMTLDTLVADTVLGGEQSCLVVAQSPDVVAGAAEAKSLQAVNVVEPRLTLKVDGPKQRFTETLAPYELTLENPGTAPAKNVRVQVTLPLSGRLYQLPANAQFNAQTRKLTWAMPQVDAGEKAVLSFQVRVGGVGLYTVAAEARADGTPPAKPDLFQTDVEGLADVNCVVSEKRRVVDLNGETTFFIRVDNAGTKEATGVLVSALLTNADAIQTSGTDQQAKYNEEQHAVVFPTIDRLAAGKTLELGIKVKASRPGIAQCRVFLVHQEMSEKIDAVARFTVVPTRR